MEKVTRSKTMGNMSLTESIDIFVKNKKAYYKQWVIDKPIVVDVKHSLSIEKLQKVIHKVIVYFVNNIDDCAHLVALSPKTKLICKALSEVEYKVGTYRTDFVFDHKMNPKLIEITCRFALNTIFISSIYDSLSSDAQKKLSVDSKGKRPYHELILYLEKLSGKRGVFILSGKDKKNESTLFKDIFKRTGRKVTSIYFTEIDAELANIPEDSFIVSELTLQEIESLNLNTITKLSELNLVNDFRTALLIHDKQFFSVLNNPDVQKACLNDEERSFFNDFLIPTYNKNENAASWNNARVNKNNWILKHRALGKSQSIYSGIVTSQKEWDRIFKEEDLDQYILQEWIEQPKIKGGIGNEKFLDYVTGTYLFFNDNFFGFGPFRTSSHPVTNVVDDRKAISITLSDSRKKIDEQDAFCFLN